MVSLAVVTASLTWATLFVVRRTAEGRVQREIQEESQNAMMTFQVLQWASCGAAAEGGSAGVAGDDEEWGSGGD